ncbi:MAG: trimethylamine methyltransferase family protein [Acidimicrobiales bacterium]
MSSRETDPASRRRGSRPRRSRTATVAQRDFGELRYDRGYQHVVSDDQVEALHQASLRLLETTGIEFLHPMARKILQDNGATVTGERVCLPGEMVEAMVAKAPTTFRLHSRTPGKSYQIGGNTVVNATVASAPNYVTLDGQRKTGDQAGYRDFLRLAQSLTIVHILGGFPVEPIDLHPSVRHLDAAYDAYTLTDMPFHVYSLNAHRIIDCLEMVRIARGVDYDTLQREPSIWSIVNANSPLRYDTPMLEGVLRLTELHQPVCFTPFTLAGAMAPITLAGALVQQNAEALAGITLAQAAHPGCPVIYGGFTSNVDMRSGSPAFGTPEYTKTAIVGGQLARRYGLPYRSSNVSASNAVDAQAGYESMWALWGAIGGGANIVMHGAGWMEGGLHASYEKMVIDADLLAMVATFLQPLDTSHDSLALEAIDRIGPGGHFFGDEHTQARYETEFHAPLVSDWRNWETWQEAGAPTADERANRTARSLIDNFEAPPIDSGVEAELNDFVQRRKAEGGIATDF